MLDRKKLLKCIENKKCDRVYNLGIVMAFASKYIGKSYRDFVLDYKTLVEGNIRVCEDFGIDLLNTMSDPCRETADFGAKVIFPEDGIPHCREYFVDQYSDLSKLKVVDPSKGARMSDRINAVRLYVEKYGSEYPVLGWVEGAFAEANDLRRMDKVMMDIYDAPEFLHEMLSICNEQAKLFAKEQIKSGCDIVGIGDAAASLVSPACYREFVLPYEKALIDEIHKCGSKVKLHICGNITNILDDVIESGADIIDIDHMVDMKTAVNKIKGRALVSGNIDPVDNVMRATYQKTYDSTLETMKIIGENGFFAPGCEIPVDTKGENLVAINDAICGYNNEIRG